jgi:hypothetical protein
MKPEKPPLRIRIFIFVNMMRENCFTPHIQKLQYGDKVNEPKEIEVFKVKNGKVVSSRKISADKDNSYTKETEVILSSFNFHLNLFVKMEKDLSNEDLKKSFGIIAESILKWLDELKSIQGKVKQELQPNYRLLYTDLWKFYEQLINSSKKLNKKHSGRPPSAKMEFKDFLNLKQKEYAEFEKALTDYIQNKIWIRKNKTDYVDLIKALMDLKYLKSNDIGLPCAKAFSKSYAYIDAPAFYRRTAKPSEVKVFKSLLKNIRKAQ